MKKFPIFLLFVFYALLFSTNVYAVSPTPEASPTGEEVLGEKIKEIRDAVKEKVREKLEEVKRGQKKAFVGKISEITNSILLLDTQGGEKQAKVATDAAIIDLKRKKINLEGLEIGNFVIAMGYLDENGILQAERIAVSEKPKGPVREVAFGRVTDISEEIITVNNEKMAIIFTIEVTNKTKITKKKDGKVQMVKITEIEIDDRLVAIGTPEENENKIITAKIIHIIPGLAKSQASPTPETSPTEE